MPRKLQIALYARISTRRPAGPGGAGAGGVSPPSQAEGQLQQLRRWAADNSDLSTQEYLDEGPGRVPLFDRPAGRRLLEDAQAGVLGEVAVVDSERLGRTDAGLAAAILRLEHLGVRVIVLEPRPE
jgi:DNA invertase Pin-like site-specific DNA recombinase